MNILINLKYMKDYEFINDCKNKVEYFENISTEKMKEINALKKTVFF
jgi:formiminotetrahydrofolate cyclodeaminase